jgi:hypothetical protein
MSAEQQGPSSTPVEQTYSKLWQLWHGVLDSLIRHVSGNQLCRASTLAVALAFLKLNGIRATRTSRPNVQQGLTQLAKVMRDEEPFK